MRPPREFSKAMAGEGRATRAALAAFFVAAVIYGGGKGDSGNGGPSGPGGAEPERGHPARVIRPEQLRDSQVNGEAAADALRWTTFSMDGNRFDGCLAWPASNLTDYVAIDVFYKESLTNAAWKNANDNAKGRNACVIDCLKEPHQFWYWDESSGTPRWTLKVKGTVSW